MMSTTLWMCSGRNFANRTFADGRDHVEAQELAVATERPRTDARLDVRLPVVGEIAAHGEPTGVRHQSPPQESGANDQRLAEIALAGTRATGASAATMERIRAGIERWLAAAPGPSGT